MSETEGGVFQVPPEQDFDTIGFQGSMQQVLQENIGNYVIVDFLIGTGSLESRQGVLYNVASQFLVLYDDINLRYVVCDIFSVKFVTFLLPGYRPGQILSNLASRTSETSSTEAPAAVPTADASPVDQPAMAPSTRTAAQAAYAHAVRKSSPSRR